MLQPLLKWILTSNRSHIRTLRHNERVEGGPTHQFLLLNANPVRERYFREEKTKFEKKNGKGKGSVLMCHGSGFGNWHVILRVGLKTSSQNDLQDAKVGMKNTNGICEGGAIGASGGAIWMAMQPSVSMGYTKAGNLWY